MKTKPIINTANRGQLNWLIDIFQDGRDSAILRHNLNPRYAQRAWWYMVRAAEFELTLLTALSTDKTDDYYWLYNSVIELINDWENYPSNYGTYIYGVRAGKSEAVKMWDVIKNYNVLDIDMQESKALVWNKQVNSVVNLRQYYKWVDIGSAMPPGDVAELNRLYSAVGWLPGYEGGWHDWDDITHRK